MEWWCRITAATSRDLHSTLSIFNDNVHADDKDGMYLLHKDDYDAVAGPDDDIGGAVAGENDDDVSSLC